MWWHFNTVLHLILHLCFSHVMIQRILPASTLSFVVSICFCSHVGFYSAVEWNVKFVVILFICSSVSTAVLCSHFLAFYWCSNLLFTFLKCKNFFFPWYSKTFINSQGLYHSRKIEMCLKTSWLKPSYSLRLGCGDIIGSQITGKEPLWLSAVVEAQALSEVSSDING